MRKHLACLAMFFIAAQAMSQTVEETWPKTLWCANDTFQIQFKSYARKFPYIVSRTDKVSPGTDANINEYATIFFGNDSIRLNYHNRIPYAHIFYINFESPKGKTTLRFHFNDLYSLFNTEYMTSHEGQVGFDIPETYELANIIWTISPTGQRARDLYKDGAYYRKVMDYFKPYLNHPLFAALDLPDSMYAKSYYDFRENSFAFNFRDPNLGADNTKMLFNGPYYYVYGDELADSSLFGKLKPLVEDFASKSKFRQFFKDNFPFYQQEITRQKELLPVKQMWQWLEKEFPKSKFQSYRVVFSPLIGGSHSTQQYATPLKPGWYTEAVMFICGTGRYDNQKNLTEKQKEGMMSGIVFTEIDHNYINQVTNKYALKIDSIFQRRAYWARAGNSSDYYESPASVFNEYMTHAAFCLYISENYDKPTADYVIGEREDLMVDRRNFIRFREFNRELLKLRTAHKELTLQELYPLILEWCGKQH